MNLEVGMVVKLKPLEEALHIPSSNYFIVSSMHRFFGTSVTILKVNSEERSFSIEESARGWGFDEAWIDTGIQETPTKTLNELF